MLEKQRGRGWTQLLVKDISIDAAVIPLEWDDTFPLKEEKKTLKGHSVFEMFSPTFQLPLAKQQFQANILEFDVVYNVFNI